MNYYAVTQFLHGAEKKWIYEEDVISQKMYDGKTPPEEDCADLLWPIGGSNSSATFIKKMESEQAIYDFLTAPGEGPDLEDPELVDLAEYYCCVDDCYGDNDCTDKFMEKFGLKYEDLYTYDDRVEEAKKMIAALKEIGYTDFDYDDPFYGDNRDWRFYEDLTETYEKVVKVA